MSSLTLPQMSQATKKKISLTCDGLFVLSILYFSLSAVFAPAPAGAVDTPGGPADYIGELKTKLGGVDDAANVVFKGAAGTIAFAGGAKLVKRVIYS